MQLLVLLKIFAKKKTWTFFLAVKKWENNVHEPRIRDMHKTESTQFKADDDNLIINLCALIFVHSCLLGL